MLPLEQHELLLRQDDVEDATVLDSFLKVVCDVSAVTDDIDLLVSTKSVLALFPRLSGYSRQAINSRSPILPPSINVKRSPSGFRFDGDVASAPPRHSRQRSNIGTKWLNHTLVRENFVGLYS